MIVCDKCKEPRQYNEKWETYYCAICNMWLEGVCPPNHSCKYCQDRPKKPLKENRIHRTPYYKHRTLESIKIILSRQLKPGYSGSAIVEDDVIKYLVTELERYRDDSDLDALENQKVLELRGDDIS